MLYWKKTLIIRFNLFGMVALSSRIEVHYLSRKSFLNLVYLMTQKITLGELFHKTQWIGKRRR
ncbi:hypothetical protein CXB77_13810 [Chromatium okenii]|uniref:Uncharacterized protein n=1 Tax=Chromatium okenii TaxID=61644 RepID=A0A2S7XNK1_9GAMM|nr:hypothetical protein CXB77_13810 [Chromatium okenii]